jgi:putative membrane protein
MDLLIRWLVYSGIIYFTCWLLPGIKVTDFRVAVIVAAVLGIINVIVKPILILFTLPITILTLGLFLLVINALMLMLVSHLVSGFRIASFGWAVLGALIISIVYHLIFWR